MRSLVRSTVEDVSRKEKVNYKTTVRVVNS